jgi:hypothetical protein
MQNTIEIKSALFPQCAHCHVAKTIAEDAMIFLKTPSKVNPTPLPLDTELHASVLCTFDTGVELPTSQVVYDETTVDRNKTFVSAETGPVDCCPGQRPAQIG